MASWDQRKQTQTQSSHSVSILKLLLYYIVCQSRLMIESQPTHPHDLKEILFSGVFTVEILLCLQTATLCTNSILYIYINNIFFEI